MVGVVRGAPRSLDLSGRAATLEVERALAGDAAPGQSLVIGWEELARGRRDRFADGDRILAALEPLPAGSLWMQRFPKRDARAVAARGQAFLRDPDARSVDLLAAFLALPRPARDEKPGVSALAAIVAEADLLLAGAAITRLGEVPGLALRLEPAAAASLAAAARDTARGRALRVRICALAGEQRLIGLRPLLAELAQRGGPLEPEALEALARLDDGLPADQVKALLERPEPALRVVGARWARDPLSAQRLARMVRFDASAEVRAAALTSLVARSGIQAVPDVTPALFDADDRVRAEAARRVGSLGAEVVPTLQSLVIGRSAEEARAPIAALAFAGQEGAAALRGIAQEHPDERVRKLARIALGELPADDHGREAPRGALHE